MYKTTKKSFLYLIVGAFLATGMLACGDIDVEENQETNQQNDENDQNDDNDQNDGNDNDGNDNDGEIDPDENDIEIAGHWDTNFDTTEDIDDEWWDFMHMIEFDNDDRWAVTQNPEDNEWGADTYNRLVWTPIEDDVFYYCTVDFNLDTEEEAMDTDATADDDDLDGGCGGNPWTEMTRQ